jgi:methylthioribose-1-phosphate isomerase
MQVWVDETRPRLQGARLTAWELMRAGVPMHLIADNASGMLMYSGKASLSSHSACFVHVVSRLLLHPQVDVVLFGADRVAVNGDVANKIGTYNVVRIRVCAALSISLQPCVLCCSVCGCPRERRACVRVRSHVHH